MRSFAIAITMKAMAMVNSSACELMTVSQTLPNIGSVPGGWGISTASGVRSRNSAPCANSMKLAGMRETRWPSLLRQISAAASHV